MWYILWNLSFVKIYIHKTLPAMPEAQLQTFWGPYLFSSTAPYWQFLAMADLKRLLGDTWKYFCFLLQG